LFVSETPEAMRSAERILKTLTAYTDRGLIYSVDMRLRPDGARGILVKDIRGYRDYYLKSAQNWEVQALLKARPVGGDVQFAGLFKEMAKEVIMHRGSSIEKSDITAMRERIVKELSQESRGMDIKLGPGGIEDIEFFIQYLQLRHAGSCPEVLGQNTMKIIRRLAEKNIITDTDRDTLHGAFDYYGKLQTFLRLNEDQVIVEGSDLADLSATFMEHKTTEEFLGYVRMLRENVLSLIHNR
jgi:glutamate-ammonia-ligase adenylyltransferase